MLTRRYWIFDLDGTLTVPVHDFGLIRKTLGVPDGIDILGFLDELPPAEAFPLHERLKQMEAELLLRTEAAPGAAMLVGHLHGQGARIGILTRNTREIAAETLCTIGLGDFFSLEAIIGREQAQPKPSPDGIYRLAGLWDAHPVETVMVGDYLYDLQAGRAAGSATVHVDPTGTFRWPELADLLVSSLTDLLSPPPADSPAAATFRSPA